jgi:hypothetical protein
MIEALIPIITSVVSATVQIGLAVHKWWQSKKDRQKQNAAFMTSRSTSDAAKELHSLMEVQKEYWRAHPGMWQALGHDVASTSGGDRTDQ